MKNLINWRMFFILLVLCVAASLLVIPYSLALVSGAGITPLNLLLSAVQNLVLFSVVIFFGLFLSQKTGMGLPLLQGFLEGKNPSKALKSLTLPSIGLGALAGISIVLLSIPFNSVIPEFQNVSQSIATWKALLASFYGGIAEEVLLRLFLVSLFVWISLKIKKTVDGLPTDFGIWLSVVLAAIVFGIGHLPATSRIVPLTGIVVVRAIVLNGIGGIAFGWLYWKKGLESAIIAHFSADIVLHVITPFVISFFQ